MCIRDSPTGGPITMPVGDQIKGRLMNVVGDSIDGMKELNRTGAYPIPVSYTHLIFHIIYRMVFHQKVSFPILP